MEGLKSVVGIKSAHALLAAKYTKFSDEPNAKGSRECSERPGV